MGRRIAGESVWTRRARRPHVVIRLPHPLFNNPFLPLLSSLSTLLTVAAVYLSQ